MSSRLALHASNASPLLLYNRTEFVAVEHSRSTPNTKVVRHPADAVLSSSIIWSCLANEEAVLQVYDTICQGDLTGKIFVECSTTRPDAIDSLAKRVEAQRGRFVAMPGLSCQERAITIYC